MMQVVLFFTLIAAVYCKCPHQCFCGVKNEKKIILCDKGGMTSIPTIDMDQDINVLTIKAPEDNPNNLTLGRIFMNFRQLEEVTVINSYIPAIGYGSFWPGSNIHSIDLSHNNISLLREKDFLSLNNLINLNLSDNSIAVSPSATFRLLTRLRNLSLARNKLNAIDPRLFFQLEQLENLDLSGNPFDDINPDNMKDLQSLKKFSLASCQLSSLNPQVYQRLPNLEEFDLRFNRFTAGFAPEEFGHMPHLKILYLDHNNLRFVSNFTFSNLRLEYLGLSHNWITELSVCAFCNSFITHLDLSYNWITVLHPDIFTPTKAKLVNLNLSYNPLSPEATSTVVHTLPNLVELSLSGTNFTYLPSRMFTNNVLLRKLNLSHNHLYNLSDSDIDVFDHLTILDLSSNSFKSLNASLLYVFDTINYVYLDSNPWSCTQCDLSDMIIWVNVSTTYERTCNDKRRYVTCATPMQLSGRELKNVSEEDLVSCTIPPQSRVGVLVDPQLGLIITVSALVLLLILVIAIVVYRRHGAVYYTHEEERHDEGDKASLTDTNGGFIDEKTLAFIGNVDKIDDKPVTKSIIA